MSRNLNKEEWLHIIELFKEEDIFQASEEYVMLTGPVKKMQSLRSRIRIKAKEVDNKGMKILDRKPGGGRKPKRDNSDIPAIIDELNEEQKRWIIEEWIKEKRENKCIETRTNICNRRKFSKTVIAKMFAIHRTTLYKPRKERIYKYDFIQDEVTKIFNDSKGIYGSRKMSIKLGEMGLKINDRTLRDYMSRWGVFTLTRKNKRKSESKNTKVKYKDLVQRNYNPEVDNIIATDVSYIPANAKLNFVYLSAAISHKTKKIESWSLSETNDTNLVLDTLNGMNRSDFILHSDHGSQYSTTEVQRFLEVNRGVTSMSRIGNSLDNREIEYFFGCLKGEYLNNINTSKMSIIEIHENISWYINWYNNFRIQKKLNWKTPAFASVISS